MTKKRVAVAGLWIYACYAAGGMAEYFLGTPAFIGLAIGVAAAIFFGLDPLRVVWPTTRAKVGLVDPPPSAEMAAPVGNPVWQ